MQETKVNEVDGFWIVRLKNDTNIHEIKEDGDRRGFREILALAPESLGWLFVDLPDKDERRLYGVDLTTGEFVIPDHVFEPNIPPEVCEAVESKEALFRPIFYRRWREAFGPEGYPKYLHRYLLGWQTTINGKNYQRLLRICPTTFRLEQREKR